ncbi:MAG: hypothetical protein ACLQBJ_19825 [Bryobacteraceae bacterium]
MRSIALIVVLLMALVPAATAAQQQGTWSEGGKPLSVPAAVNNPPGAGPLTLTYTDARGKTSAITLSPGARISIAWDAKSGRPSVRLLDGRLDWDLNSVSAMGFSAPRQTVTVNATVGYVIVESSQKLGGAGIVFIIGGTAGVVVGTYFGLQSSTPVSPHQ